MIKSHLYFAILASAACLFSAHGQMESPPAAGAMDAGVEKKHQEFMQLQKEITEVERQAQSSEPVQETMSEFRDAVAREMAQQAPEMREDVARQTELVEELTTGDPAGEERDEKIAEYQELRSKLMPVEQRVQQAEDVARAREAYTSTLISEMEKIDPEITAKLQRHSELAAELQQGQAGSRG